MPHYSLVSYGGGMCGPVPLCTLYIMAAYTEGVFENEKWYRWD